MHDEGYIKFNCIWQKAEALEPYQLSALIHCRQELFRQELIGGYANGIGYGNLSERIRDSNHFIISGTQTGGITQVNASHFTEVTDFDFETNSVHCRGPLKASSESLTHAACYSASPEIQAVIHVHHDGFWRYLCDNYPSTASAVPYGTPQMAREILNLLKDARIIQLKMLAMAGHEGGIIAFGDSLSRASPAARIREVLLTRR